MDYTLNALILIDHSTTTSDEVAEAAHHLMGAHARVRYVSVENLVAEDFKNITYLVMTGEMPSLGRSVRDALDDRTHHGMQTVQMADVPRMMWFRNQSTVFAERA
jgi:hypothetical protein